MAKVEEIGEIKGREGEWVVVVDNKVVASSDSAEEMFRLANEKYSGKNVNVVKILFADASFY